MRIALLLAVAGCLAAADTLPPERVALRELIASGERWLASQQQPNGAFLPGDRFLLGITELAIDALVREPATTVSAKSPAADKAVGFVMGYRRDDGGFYDPVEGMGIYGTSLALISLRSADRLDPAVARSASDFLLRLQNRDPASQSFGGIGSGSFSPERSLGGEDLHHTSHAIEALRDSGLPADDPRMRDVLAFLERCHNRSALNDPQPRPWVSNDGGAVYSPTTSKAGGDWQQADGDEARQAAMRSYGSMTYALLSSYLALDLPADDPRVAAALAWIRANYTVSANPGMPEGKTRQGLYYCNAVMAKTMGLLRITTFTTTDGRTVDWRRDLLAALRERAVPATLGDGSGGCYWLNSEQRWGEGLPHLCTVYAISALKHIDANW